MKIKNDKGHSHIIKEFKDLKKAIDEDLVKLSVDLQGNVVMINCSFENFSEPELDF